MRETAALNPARERALPWARAQRSQPALAQHLAPRQGLLVVRAAEAAAQRQRAERISSDGCASAHRAARIRALSDRLPARRGSAGAFPSCIHKYRRRWRLTSCEVDHMIHFIIFPRRVQQKRRYRFVKNGNAFLLYELLLHCLGLDLHCPAAEVFVNAVRNGENGAPRGGAAQRFEHARFGLRVEIRGDLVQ